MLERLPLAHSTGDAYERLLNMGVTLILPAPDRVSPLTTETGRTVIAVVTVEMYSEVRPLRAGHHAA